MEWDYDSCGKMFYTEVKSELKFKAVGTYGDECEGHSGKKEQEN